jgi:hypothetical protein
MMRALKLNSNSEADGVVIGRFRKNEVRSGGYLSLIGSFTNLANQNYCKVSFRVRR